MTRHIVIHNYLPKRRTRDVNPRQLTLGDAPYGKTKAQIRAELEDLAEELTQQLRPSAKTELLKRRAELLAELKTAKDASPQRQIAELRQKAMAVSKQIDQIVESGGFVSLTDPLSVHLSQIRQKINKLKRGDADQATTIPGNVYGQGGIRG